MSIVLKILAILIVLVALILGGFWTAIGTLVILLIIGAIIAL